MARILIVEDEVRLASSLRRGLEEEHHVVDVAHDGVDGLCAALATETDLVVLDLMLPRLSGMEVCRRLRREGRTVPILVLTARDATADVVAGLDAGADDYLTKPFAFNELLARIRSLLRRSVGVASSRYCVGPLELDAAAHRVWRDGEEVALTAKEYMLLEALMRRPGTVLSRTRLEDVGWDGDDSPASNALEVHIASLRRKIDRDRPIHLIHTVRGVGYVLRVDGA